MANVVFPPNPATGQRYFHIDDFLEYVWDGGRWLSVAEFTIPFVPYAALPNNLAATANVLLVKIPIYRSGLVLLTTWDSFTNTAAPVATWTFALKNDAATTIDAGFNTAADTIGVSTPRSRTVNGVRTIATDIYWFISATKAAAGNTNIAAVARYRIIG